MTPLRFLLLQVRNADDPMRAAEVLSFARALEVPSRQIEVFDLLAGFPGERELASCDVVLLGGAGHYSVAEQTPWLTSTLQGLQAMCLAGKPTFASCWGFQAIAAALGGRVIKNVPQAEVGTLPVSLTEDGRRDPVFGTLPSPFWAQLGHEDHVVELPEGTVWLATSEKARHQAFRLEGLPVYCTQFHPELSAADFMARLAAYPHYVTQISGLAMEHFHDSVRDTPEAESLLRRYVTVVFGE